MKLELSKEELLKSAFGEELKSCVDDICFWSRHLDQARMRHDKDLEKKMRRAVYLEKRRFDVYSSALRVLCDMNYVLCRTDTYYGLVNPNDETDWLFKRERRD